MVQSDGILRYWDFKPFASLPSWLNAYKENGKLNFINMNNTLKIKIIANNEPTILSFGDSIVKDSDGKILIIKKNK